MAVGPPGCRLCASLVRLFPLLAPPPSWRLRCPAQAARPLGATVATKAGGLSSSLLSPSLLPPPVVPSVAAPSSPLMTPSPADPVVARSSPLLAPPLLPPFLPLIHLLHHGTSTAGSSMLAVAACVAMLVDVGGVEGGVVGGGGGRDEEEVVVGVSSSSLSLSGGVSIFHRSGRGMRSGLTPCSAKLCGFAETGIIRRGAAPRPRPQCASTSKFDPGSDWVVLAVFGSLWSPPACRPPVGAWLPRKQPELLTAAAFPGSGSAVFAALRGAVS